MKHLMVVATMIVLAACGGDEPPADEPPAEPDGGVLGESLLDAQRQAEEARETVEARKRELDKKLDELEGRDTDD
ncbi:MAG: hypothetical protein AAFX44_14655 [Pseudomonadota bacterium]